MCIYATDTFISLLIFATGFLWCSDMDQMVTVRQVGSAQAIVIYNMHRKALTRTDSDSFNELLSPAVCSNHKGEVCLLNKFVHSTLERLKRRT